MNGYQIRLARPEEYGTIGELTVGAYLADGPVSEGYVDELKDAASRALVGELLVAEDLGTGELLGTASLFTWRAAPRWSEGATDGEAVLRMLAVAPLARRRGVGRALTLECIRRASELGCDRLNLLSATTMQAAHALYRQLGFTRNPDADRSPIPGVHLLAFYLLL